MKSVKKTIIACFLLAFPAGILIFATTKNIPKACYNNTCFNLAIADTEYEREQGLMFKKNLAQNTGMFFIFKNENIYPFWMKNTFIPLDIIWLDNNLKIVFIKNSAQPCADEKCPSITPDKKAKYVLEINAGIAEKLEMNIGNFVSLIK